jgi:hypothetical protein
MIQAEIMATFINIMMIMGYLEIQAFDKAAN